MSEESKESPVKFTELSPKLFDTIFSRNVDRSRSGRCSPGLRLQRLNLGHHSPKGRLRLIKFLQDLNLDKALYSLSDECTLEDLLHISEEHILNIFKDNLGSKEIEKLSAALRKQAFPINYHRTRSRRNSDLASINRSLSSSLSGATNPGVFNIQEPINYRSGAHSPSPGAYQTSPAIFPEDTADGLISLEKRPSISPHGRDAPTLDHSCEQSIYRTSSLGVYDTRKLRNCLRPVSLSTVTSAVSNCLRDASIPSSCSPIQPALAPSIPSALPTALSSQLRNTTSSPLSISPHCIDFDMSSFLCNPAGGRRSNLSNLSAERLSGSRQMAGGHLSTWNSSGASHRSSLMPPLFGQQISNPGSVASPGPGYNSFTGHSLGTNLIRLRQGSMGKSAPNLFSSCRDTSSSVSSCFHANTTMDSTHMANSHRYQVQSLLPLKTYMALNRCHRSRFLSGCTSSSITSQDPELLGDTGGCELSVDVYDSPSAASLQYRKIVGSPHLPSYRSFDAQSASPSGPSPRNVFSTTIKTAIAVAPVITTSAGSVDNNNTSLTAAMDGLRVVDCEGTTASNLTTSTPPHPTCSRQRLTMHTNSQPLPSVCQQCGSSLNNESISKPPHLHPHLRLESIQQLENRRWSLASLPSSGYETNTPGSSNLSSHYSSKENIQVHHRAFAPLLHQTSMSPIYVHSPVHYSDSPASCDSPTPKPLVTIKPPNTMNTVSSCRPVAAAAAAGASKTSAFFPPVHHHISDHSSSSAEESTGSVRGSIGIPELSASPLGRAGTPIRRSQQPATVLCVKCSKSLRASVAAVQPLSYDLPIHPQEVTAPVTPLKMFTEEEGEKASATALLPCNTPPMSATPFCKHRSKSFSPIRSSNSCEQDIFLLNHVYRERFPKASAQMQQHLRQLCADMESEATVAWSAVARFVHVQVLQLARDCLEKALSGVITCRYFYELTENLEKLVKDARVKDASSVTLVTGLVQKFMLIISRPARLLECLEFDPSEFYQMLEMAESQGRPYNLSGATFSESAGGFISADVPRYIISKLGLTSPATIEHVEGNTDEILSSVPSTVPYVQSPILPDTSTAVLDPDCPPSDGNGCQQQINTNPAPVPPSRRRPCEADFEIIKLISNGAYGAVYLVRDRITRQRYGMKKMLKTHLRHRNQVDQVFAERDILSFADNPFVVSLYCTFETKKCLCLVMEFVEGGDVATLLKNIGGPLPTDLAQMYFAELVLALEYLHNYGIVHRDLKPDNLLITHEGHIKLTDFGLSRIGLMTLATNIYECSLDLEKDCKMFRDKQVFGTPEYIAPEVILRGGYGKPVDWWSSGIILYEFLIGVVPFYGDTIEELFSHIVSGPIEWSNEEEDESSLPMEAMDVILRLLERDPLLRLGTASGAAEVKESPFFEGIDWNNLLRQKSAFVPQLEHEEDCSYFDTRNDRYQHDVDDDEDIDNNIDFFFPSIPSYSYASSVVSQGEISDSYSVLSMESSAATSRASSKERKPVVAYRELDSTVEEQTTTTLTAAEGRLTAERLQCAIVAESGQQQSLVSAYLIRQSEATAEEHGAEAGLKNDTGDEDKEEEEKEEEIQDENLFHAFASCSPRFSLVMDQARMAELLPHLNAVSAAHGGDEAVHMQSPLRGQERNNSICSSYSDSSLQMSLVDTEEEKSETTPTRDTSCKDEEKAWETATQNELSLDSRRETLQIDACDRQMGEEIDGYEKVIKTSEEIQQPSLANSSQSQCLPPLTATGSSDCSSDLKLTAATPTAFKRTCINRANSNSAKKRLVVEPVSKDDSRLRRSPVSSSSCLQQPSLRKKTCLISQRLGSPQSVVTSKLVIPPTINHRSGSPSLRSCIGQVVSGTIIQTPTTVTTPLRRSRVDVGASTRNITISRGLRGYGFTTRARDVFYGATNVYTLNHIVVGLNRKGPAYEAGLRENDLVLRVNGNEVTGRPHVEVVQLIYQIGITLKLQVISMSASNIRSDGHWRERGRLVMQSGRQNGSKTASKSVASTSSDELSSRILLRSHTKSGGNVPPPVTERRQRHKFAWLAAVADSSSGTASPLLAPPAAAVNALRPLRVHTEGKEASSSLVSQRPHSQSFSVKTSRQSPSGDVASSRLHPNSISSRRSVETPLFRQLSERNRSSFMPTRSSAVATGASSGVSSSGSGGVSFSLASPLGSPVGPTPWSGGSEDGQSFLSSPRLSLSPGPPIVAQMANEPPPPQRPLLPPPLRSSSIQVTSEPCNSMSTTLPLDASRTSSVNVDENNNFEGVRLRRRKKPTPISFSRSSDLQKN